MRKYREKAIEVRKRLGTYIAVGSEIHEFQNEEDQPGNWGPATGLVECDVMVCDHEG